MSHMATPCWAIAEPRDVITGVQMRYFTWAEKQTMKEGFSA